MNYSLIAHPFQKFWRPFATESQKINYFGGIFIEIHSPGNLPALVWFRSGEKPRTSSPKIQCGMRFVRLPTTLEPATNGLGVMSDLVLLIAVAPPSGRLGRDLVT